MAHNLDVGKEEEYNYEDEPKKSKFASLKFS